MMSKMRVFSASGFIAGLLLTALGFFFWATNELNTKLFQLSNDLIGAGVFIVVVSLIIFFRSKK